MTDAQLVDLIIRHRSEWTEKTPSNADLFLLVKAAIGDCNIYHLQVQSDLQTRYGNYKARAVATIEAMPRWQLKFNNGVLDMCIAEDGAYILRQGVVNRLEVL